MMVENVTALRALQTTVSGSNHKPVVVRVTVVRLMDKMVTTVGAERVAGSSKEFQEIVMQSGAKFLLDPAIEVRKLAKHMFAELIKHRRFEAMQKEFLSEAQKKDIKKTLDSL